MNLDEEKLDLNDFLLGEKEVYATVEEFKEMKRVESKYVKISNNELARLLNLSPSATCKIKQRKNILQVADIVKPSE